MVLEKPCELKDLADGLLSPTPATCSVLSRATVNLPAPQKGAGIFAYRGFHFIILAIESGFQAVILNNGNPIRVNWNGRDIWHSIKRAKQMAHQFIKVNLKWNPDAQQGISAQNLSANAATSRKERASSGRVGA
jgi:hypothetical protein